MNNVYLGKTSHAEIIYDGWGEVYGRVSTPIILVLSEIRISLNGEVGH